MKKSAYTKSKKLRAVDIAKYVSFYSFFTAVVVALFFFVSSAMSHGQTRTVGVKHEATIRLPEKEIQVEIAKKGSELERGLSYRKSIASDEGMLFVFDEMGQYPFWMKDMNFPLDILWISDEGRVVYLAENATPESYVKGKKVFQNDAFAKYVLEIKAGKAHEYGVYLGTSIGLPNSVQK